RVRSQLIALSEEHEVRPVAKASAPAAPAAPANGHVRFVDAARLVLAAGYTDAYSSGWDDSGADGSPDDAVLGPIVDTATGNQHDWLTGLAALLLAGGG